MYHGIVLLLLYIVLLCLRYFWFFFFFSEQVLDCLINCKWRSYGSGFVLEKLSVIFHCTSWFAVFVQNILLCPYFMLSQDAIRFHFLRQKAKRQAGKHEFTTALQLVSFCPSKDDIPNIFHLIESFVVLLYDSTSTSSSVKECRKELLSKKGRLPDDIPPAADAVQFHIYRAIYQASYCWA